MGDDRYLGGILWTNGKCEPTSFSVCRVCIVQFTVMTLGLKAHVGEKTTNSDCLPSPAAQIDNGLHAGFSHCMYILSFWRATDHGSAKSQTQLRD